MKVLVLAENYSTKTKISQAFIHTRNREYIKYGLEVDVISFASKESYILDDIRVYSLEDFYTSNDVSNYDVIISHAPNLKNHCRFINKNKKKIKKIIFFFHGHEVLISKEVYPIPYSFMKKDKLLKESIRNIYDHFKIRYMTSFLKKYLNVSEYIFVSEWMYEEFKKNIKIPTKEYENKKHIIYNSLGEIFLKENYDTESKKQYDFITIRNILDVSKYCIDVVNNLAKNNPNYKFLIVGKGEFFEHYEKASNLDLELKNLTHTEIIQHLNNAKYALMPTRADAQGVMMCEMATFGIPVITSDIYVCKAVLGDLKNVEFINNNLNDTNLTKVIENLKPSKQKPEKFSYKNTIYKEIELIKK